MDLARISRAGAGLGNLPEYIVTNFIPGAQPLIQKYPRAFRFLGVLLALWYFGPVARLRAVWSQFAQFFISTIIVSSEEDVFQHLVTWIAEKRTLRADQTLNALSNTRTEDRQTRRGRRDNFEEIARQQPEDPKIKYEQTQGLQIFVHKKRIFFVKRTNGEGHVYTGSRYKRMESLVIFCFGRSTQPVKDLIEHVYQLSKFKERTMTIIRRPFNGGSSSRLNWSRLTAKPRRGLDTVILDPSQKAALLQDIEEYVDENTQQFYGDHGIPYRRGYLFYGPPGCGKTSMALALASKFNLDVYVLTLLDQALTDSDLMALMNQLPSSSLLLLEDIDTAGLTRKKTSTPAAPSAFGGGRGGGRRGMPESTVAAVDVPEIDSDDEDFGRQTSRVSLSGLLNAVDGVAAPEGHILIMTTNKPHELDEALVRAGRISVKVAFSNASKQQAESIFLRMFVETTKSDTSMDSVEKPDPASVADPKTKALAKEFAEQIPDGAFSPADLQDYLLLHKKDPQRAIDTLKTWMASRDDDQKRKDAEKEAEKKHKAMKAQLKRAQFREDVEAALGRENKPGDTEVSKEQVNDQPAEKSDAGEGKVAEATGKAGKISEKTDKQPVEDQTTEADTDVFSEAQSR